MTDPSVVVLVDQGESAEALRLVGLRYPSFTLIDASDGASSTCAAINEVAPASPVVIVAVGRAALTLPAVARSQRAMHRLVLEYVLLDPDLPPVSDTWPDARVTVACDVDSEASLQARLRGWDVLSVEDLGHAQDENRDPRRG